VAGFSVAQTDLAEAVTFLEQFLSTSLPQYDFSQGTSARDIAINSIAYVVAFMRREIANVRNRQSLLKLSEAITDLDEASATELVNEILSDVFLTRKTGGYSRGFVTLKFTNQQIGVVTFSTSSVFTKGSSSFKLASSDSVTFQATDLIKNTDNLGVNFYTVTLELQAVAVGADHDVDPGTFSDYPQVSPHLVDVTSLEKFTGGKGVETSSEMIKRSETAITVRDLNTIPSITTVLTNIFSQVLEVEPIGMGDIEMQRDLIEIPRGTSSTIKIHRGSKMDIYVKFPVEFRQVYTSRFPGSPGLVAQGYVVNGDAITAVKLPAFPIYRIANLLDKAVDPVVEVPFTVVTDSSELWNSSRQSVYLSINPAYSGATLDMVYDSVVGYAAVQQFVEDKRNRIVVADALIKASFALYLKFEVRYYPTALVIADVAAVKTTLQAFLHNRTLGLDFKVSEITCFFMDRYPGNNVQFPFVVVGELHLPNGKVLTMTFADKIEAPEKYYYDELTPSVLTPLFIGDPEPGDKVVLTLAGLQVSTKTMRYVVDTADIEITAVTA